MSDDDLADARPPAPAERRAPLESVRQDARPKTLRRFYAEATVARQPDGEWRLLLDGRPARTPAKRYLQLAGERRAQALAAEWAGQGETIDPADMPITRIVNSALDGLADRPEAMAETRADVVRYAGSDLLCYRAAEPAALVAEQTRLWDPVLDWARARLGARFRLAEGVMFLPQPPEATAAVAAAVARFDDPVSLAALHVMTTLTGSALLALATAEGELAAEAAWSAAHVDEDCQVRLWGEDAEALARRKRRWREMQAAAMLAQRLPEANP